MLFIARCSSLILSIALTANQLLAKESNALQFLTMGTGVRALGMGGTGAASHDSTSPHWNPAGIAAIDRHELSLMHAQWLEEFRFQTFSYAAPLSPSWSGGLSVAHFSRSGIAAYDNGGVSAGSFGISDTAATLTVAADIGSWFRAPDRFYSGFNAKYLREDLEVKTVSGFAGDWGFGLVPYKNNKAWLLDRVEFGASVHNLGPAIKFDKEEDSLPMMYRAGFSVRGWAKSFLLATDYEKPADDSGSVRSGLEVLIFDTLAFRGGYRWALKDNQDTLQNGYHVGIGFVLGSVGIDYAFVPHLKVDDSHFLGIRWFFGGATRLAKVERRLAEHFRAAQRAYSRKDFARAKEELEHVLTVDPSHEGARALREQNQKQLASLKVDWYLALGQKHLAAADYSEARDHFKAILDVDPNHAVAAELLKEADKGIAEDKKQRRDVLSKQAEEFYKQNNYQDAIDIWEKVLLLDPGNPDVTASLQKARAKLEEQRRLMAAAEESKTLEKGWVYLNAKKPQKAKEVAEEVLKRNPSSEGAQTLLAQANSRLANEQLTDARAFIQKKDRRKAFAALKQAFALDRNNKIVSDLLTEVRKDLLKTEGEEALNLYSQQKYKEALEKFTYLILEVDPDAKDLIGYRDETRKRLSEFNQADAERLNREGLKAYDQGKLQEAIEFWKKALQIHPDHANARRNLDRAEQQLKQ